SLAATLTPSLSTPSLHDALPISRPYRPVKRCVPVASNLRKLALLLTMAWLAGCSSLLFYPEPGLPITPERAGLEYRDIELRAAEDRKSTRLNSSHVKISYAVLCL